MRMNTIAATTPTRRTFVPIPKSVSGNQPGGVPRGVEAGPRAHGVVVPPSHGGSPRPRIAGPTRVRLSKRIDVDVIRAEVGLVCRVVSRPPEHVADQIEEPGVPP